MRFFTVRAVTSKKRAAALILGKILSFTFTLFETFCPFDIEDIYLSQPQLLIVLQSLSQHPWMVRRIIQHDKKKTKFFTVTLFPKQIQVAVNID